MRLPATSALTACLLFVFGGLKPGVLAADAVRRPNVILVMTDDQGYGDLGCHGNPIIKTPALDALHAKSVRLTDYHVDPTCSPTRAALMTGRYSSRTGVWHTIMGRSILHSGETTMADVFAAGGYRTGIFGKWHLGDNYPYRPQDRGFHEVLVHGGGGVGQTPDHWGNDYSDDTYFENGTPKEFSGYCTDVWFDAALRFIEENKDRPFFAYIPTNAPHGPFRVPEKYSEPYKKRGVPSPRAEFYGMITNIDENMAHLTRRLKELELEENTILIFTTDNGTAAGYAARRSAAKKPRSGGQAARRNVVRSLRDRTVESRSDPTTLRAGYNAGMRGTKGSEYDGGHRVPFFIRWPAGNLTGGRDVKELTAHIDVLPTLIDLCDLKPPENVRMDGRSLAAILDPADRDSPDSATDWPARTLFVHSQRLEHPHKWRKAAVMTDRWRLVTDGDRRELFDIQADPGQNENVADEQHEVFAKLSKAYEEWYSDVSERFAEYVRIPLGGEKAGPQHLTCHDWHTGDRPVPWNHDHIRRDLEANGFWAVEVVRPGTYEITLRTRPAHVKHPLNATTARVKIGEVEATRRIAPGATEITIPLTLEPGKAKLQTWLEAKGGASRGAYFVEVKSRTK